MGGEIKAIVAVDFDQNLYHCVTEDDVCVVKMPDAKDPNSTIVVPMDRYFLVTAHPNYAAPGAMTMRVPYESVAALILLQTHFKTLVVPMSQRIVFTDATPLDKARKEFMYLLFDKLFGKNRNIMTRDCGDEIARKSLALTGYDRNDKTPCLLSVKELYGTPAEVDDKEITLLDDSIDHVEQARNAGFRAIHSLPAGTQVADVSLAFCQLLLERFVVEKKSLNLKDLFTFITPMQSEDPDAQLTDSMRSTLKLAILRTIAVGIPESSSLSESQRRALERSAVSLLVHTPYKPGLFCANSSSVEFPGLGEVSKELDRTFGLLISKRPDLLPVTPKLKAEKRLKVAEGLEYQLATLSRFHRALSFANEGALVKEATELMGNFSTRDFDEKLCAFLVKVNDEANAVYETVCAQEENRSHHLA